MDNGEAKQARATARKLGGRIYILGDLSFWVFVKDNIEYKFKTLEEFMVWAV